MAVRLEELELEVRPVVLASELTVPADSLLMASLVGDCWARVGDEPLLVVVLLVETLVLSDVTPPEARRSLVVVVVVWVVAPPSVFLDETVLDQRLGLSRFVRLARSTSSPFRDSLAM